MKILCLSAGILFADVGCAPIDHAPVPGELIHTESIELSLGGCASNVSINLAKLEIPTGLVGCVGDDAFSDFILDSLENPLVDISGVRRVENSCPGCSMIVNVRNEDRRFVSVPGANSQLAVEDVPQAWTDEAKVLYLGGYLMLERLESPDTVEYFKAFQERGGKTILDVVLHGDRPYWSALEPLLPYVDYFMPNDDEGYAISGMKDPVDQAKMFTDAGAKTCIITLGDKGSIYYSADEKFRADIFRTDFVGGTGSGDAFDAGLVAALLNGCDAYESVRRATAQGMSCVRHSSATQSVFTKRELEEFLDGRELKTTPLK
ncbi:MAG: carbohydrate kinase family protein [Thermoguttaceae bacterium]|jgi:sugar/nucleoside kinase (ribokinase family)